MKPKRNGFTLLELLTVLLIIGILATIGVNRFWHAKGRAFKAALRSDLRTMAVQQERYFDQNFVYASSPGVLPDFVASDGVTLTVTWSAREGWAAVANHASLDPADQCAYFTGPAPSGVAPPAVTSGIMECN